MKMNSINVKAVTTPYDYDENYLVIDGKPLTEWFQLFVKEQKDKNIENFGTLLGLYPAWGGELLWKGEIRFVWTLIERQEPTILPLLVCEEDLDLSCMVFVALVRKDDTCIYWDKLGYVLHENEDYKEEVKRGILYTEAYTQEDWEKYGDNIAWESVDSQEWKEWIAKNFDQEMYRRRMNYTLPYYETEGNIQWLKEVNWVFRKEEYEGCVSFYREQL